MSEYWPTELRVSPDRQRLTVAFDDGQRFELSAEMLRVFNCGIGMVLVVDAADADAVMRHLGEQGETVYRLGELGPGEGPAKVAVDGLDAAR